MILTCVLIIWAYYFGLCMGVNKYKNDYKTI